MRDNYLILVVEDEPLLLELLLEQLSMFGYKAISATNGNEAVLLFSKNSEYIDLVILDWMIPEKTGKEVINSLKYLKNDVKVLIASGYYIEDIKKSLSKRSKKTKSSNIYYLQKPYSMCKLKDKLSKILAIKNNDHPPEGE